MTESTASRIDRVARERRQSFHLGMWIRTTFYGCRIFLNSGARLNNKSFYLFFWKNLKIFFKTKCYNGEEEKNCNCTSSRSKALDPDEFWITSVFYQKTSLPMNPFKNLQSTRYSVLCFLLFSDFLMSLLIEGRAIMCVKSCINAFKSENNERPTA